MSQIRKAHTVEIIDRRLRDVEAGGVGDVMELVGLHDELARVERKWREKSQAAPRTGPRARPPSDADAMNARFERLTRLVEAALRRVTPAADSPERALLAKAAEALRTRTPLKSPPAGG